MKQPKYCAYCETGIKTLRKYIDPGDPDERTVWLCQDCADNNGCVEIEKWLNRNRTTTRTN